MIYLLYGSDTRASLEKLKEIVDEYRKKYGDLNIHRFDAEEDEPGKIKSVLGASSLFSPKKIVVIREFSKAPEKEIIFQAFESLKDTIVVLWEKELGKEELAEIKPYAAKVQEFKESLTQPIDDKAIFRLGDTFFTDKKEALRNLLGLLDEGFDERNIFSYLTNHLRTLMLVKYFSDRQKPIPPTFKIHPYVIQKAKILVRGFAPGLLQGLLYRFFEEDLKIKTGASKPGESLVKMLVTGE